MTDYAKEINKLIDAWIKEVRLGSIPMETKFTKKQQALLEEQVSFGLSEDDIDEMFINGDVRIVDGDVDHVTGDVKQVDGNVSYVDGDVVLANGDVDVILKSYMGNKK